jgi:hypothetical protein
MGFFSDIIADARRTAPREFRFAVQDAAPAIEVDATGPESASVELPPRDPRSAPATPRPRKEAAEREAGLPPSDAGIASPSGSSLAGKALEASRDHSAASTAMEAAFELRIVPFTQERDATGTEMKAALELPIVPFTRERDATKTEAAPDSAARAEVRRGPAGTLLQQAIREIPATPSSGPSMPAPPQAPAAPRAVVASSAPQKDDPRGRTAPVTPDAGPRVHIGRVEVVVVAPPATIPRPPSVAPVTSLASRRYLRNA